MRIRNFFFFSSRRRHTRSTRDWSSDVCSSDLAAPELRLQLEDADPGVLLCSDDYADLGATLHPRAAALEALQQPVARSVPEPSDDDGLLLVYTSGTTGKPKGALLT